MKKRSSRLWEIFGAALLFGIYTGAHAIAANLTVDNDGVECPAAGFSTIQAAVNAASPGSNIHVCPGIYNEQVSIPKQLRLEGENGTIIKPAPMAANTTNLFSGNPIAAAVLVTAPTGNVVITSLTVDTGGNGIAGCSPELIGIYYRNASGTVQDAAVREVEVGDPSCNSGVGIFAQSGGTGSATVTVRGTSVHDYQRSGLIGNEAKTSLTALDNVLKGAGPATGVSQHGIQIGFGATGILSRNASFAHISETCTAIPCNTATGILILEANGVRAQNNTSTGNQTGLFILDGNNNRLTNNKVFGSDLFDGIILVGNANEAVSNDITGTNRAGVAIVGDNNKVRGNHINEAQIGVWNQSGSGNATTPNVIVNTQTPYLTGPGPIVARTAAVSGVDDVSAYR